MNKLTEKYMCACLSILFCILFTGCATSSKYFLPPDDALRNDLGKIYLDVIPFSYHGKFEEPIKGKGKSALIGAGVGTLTPLAVAASESCYDLFECALVMAVGIALAPVGAVVGGIYGATAGSTEEEVNRALTSFNDAVSQYEYSSVLEREFMRHKNIEARYYLVEPIDDRTVDYPSDGTILEIRINKLNWVSVGKIDPDLYLSTTIEARLLKDLQANNIYYRKWQLISHEKDLDDLTDNNSELLKKGMTEILSMLAKQIVFDLLVNQESEKEELNRKMGNVYTISASHEKIDEGNTTVNENI